MSPQCQRKDKYKLTSTRKCKKWNRKKLNKCSIELLSKVSWVVTKFFKMARIFQPILILARLLLQMEWRVQLKVSKHISHCQSGPPILWANQMWSTIKLQAIRNSRNQSPSSNSWKIRKWKLSKNSSWNDPSAKKKDWAARKQS